LGREIVKIRHHSMLSILLLSLVAVPSVSVIPSVQAMECAATVVPIDWNVTIERQALVPFANSYNYYDMQWEDERMVNSEIDGTASSTSIDTTLHPEEPWMYQVNWQPPTLLPLTSNHYTSMLVGNDSSAVLRLNLSSDHRTTFCVSISSYNQTNISNDAIADVYLMTSSQYRNYEQTYQSLHQSDMFWYDEVANAIADVPPEWRSFNPAGWTTYRDVHQYESTDDVTFSVSLDGPEIYSSIFGSTTWEDFYLVIDAWDNPHSSDGDAAQQILAVDVTIVTEERSALLPNWTVPLVFFVLVGTGAVAPFILNARYTKAGLGEASKKYVPTMSQSLVDQQN